MNLYVDKYKDATVLHYSDDHINKLAIKIEMTNTFLYL